MLSSHLSLFPAAVVFCLVPSLLAAGRGPSTPSERERVLALAAEGPKDPLQRMAADGRWFLKWVEEVPDIQFGPEAPALWMDHHAQGDLKRVGIFLYELGGVAWMIQHHVQDPRKAPELMLPIHTAALEAVVRGYETLRERAPGNRSDGMDEALARLKAGTFPAFVSSLFEKR